MQPFEKKPYFESTKKKRAVIFLVIIVLALIIVAIIQGSKKSFNLSKPTPFVTFTPPYATMGIGAPNPDAGILGTGYTSTPKPSTYKTLMASGGNSSGSSTFDINKDLWDCSHDSIGNVIFTGKIINNSSLNYRFVKLRGTVYDKSNNVVNTDWSYIDSDILYANSSSTFTIYVEDPNSEGASCIVQTEDFETY